MIRRTWQMFLSGIVAACLVCTAATAQQGEPTDREKELEKTVRELNERLIRMETRLNDLERAKPAGFVPPQENLDTRVEQLERNVEEIKKSTPPAEGSEDWEKMRKAVDLFSESNTMRPYWKDGLRLDSLDGSFKLKIGGRVQVDWAFFGVDDDIEDALGEQFEDGVEFRRARINMSGDIYDNIEFRAEYDFAGGEARFTDVYMGIKNVPVVGNVRIGHFFEPFILNEITSDNYHTFMEIGLVSAFAPGRNTGIMVFDAPLDERMTWAVGFFRDTDNFGNGSGGRNYHATTRLTGLPWYADEGAQLVHLGIGYTHQNYEDDTVRFRARPESNQAPRFVDTADFSAEYGDIIDAQGAVVLGPFSMQSEYVQAWIDSRTMSDPDFWSWYAQASYILTGEHRRYNRKYGVFEGVTPQANFGKDGGWGAWELAARYSHLDLNDGWVRGGLLRDFTLGLNWYLNPNMRMMLNYILADAEDRGDANVVQMRFQLHY